MNAEFLMHSWMRLTACGLVLWAGMSAAHAEDVVDPTEIPTTPTEVPITSTGTVSCGAAKRNGDSVPQRFPIRINGNAQINLDYEMYTIPDKLSIVYGEPENGGVTLTSTGGPVSNQGHLSANVIYQPGHHVVNIVVTPSTDESTLWNFTYQCTQINSEEPDTSKLPKPGEIDCTTISKGNSAIDDVQLDHWHEAVDYAVVKPAGCTPCQTGMNATGDLGGFTFKRVHRYRYMDRSGSFGPGVFCNFDTRLTLATNGAWAEVWDPYSQSPIRLTPTGIGFFEDSDRGLIKSVTLTDDQGQPTSSPRNGSRARLDYWDGRAEIFEDFQHTTKLSSNATEYENYARLVQRIDANGQPTTIVYRFPVDAKLADIQYKTDNFWCIDSITDPYGNQARLEYSVSAGAPVVSRIMLPNGSAVVYHYDENGMIGLSGVIYPTGEQASFSVQQNDAEYAQLVSIFDPGAEGIHRVKTLWLNGSAWGYSPNNYQTTNPAYNMPANRIRKVINGAGEISYQTWVRKVPVDDPLSAQGITHQLFVYQGGNQGAGILKRHDQANSLTMATWKSLSGLTGFDSQDPASVTWELEESFTYDNKSHTTTKTIPDVGVEQIIRNAAGAATVSTLLQADGATYAVRHTDYNGVNRPLLETDSLGRRTVYEYNGSSANPTAITRAEGTSSASTQHFTYNGRGQPLTSTDPNGNVTEYHYTANGYLEEVVEPRDYAGAPQAVRSFHYAVGGLVESIVDAAGRAVHFHYDARNRLVLTNYADGTTESVTYESGAQANLPVATTDRNGNRHVFIYDAAGRVTSDVLINGVAQGVQHQETWTYVPGSTLVSSHQDGSFTERSRHDHRNRLVEVDHPSEGRLWTESFAYDRGDREVRATDRFDRRTWFLRDREGRATRIARELIGGHPLGDAPDLAALSFVAPGMADPPWVLERSVYDTEGRLLRQADARGIESVIEYDDQGRVTARVQADHLASMASDASVGDTSGSSGSSSGSGGSSSLGFLAEAARTEYSYDAAGNVVSVRSPRHFSRSGAGFVPSGIHCETQTIYTGRNLPWKTTRGVGTADASTVITTYTLTGKPETVTDPRNPLWVITNHYGVCCDRLTDVIDALGFASHMTYDGNGNLLTATDPNQLTTTSTYDARNRPLTVTNGAGETMTHLYDDDLTDGSGFEALISGILAQVPANRADIVVHAVVAPTGEMVVTGANRFGEAVFSADAAGKVTIIARTYLAAAGGQEVVTTNALGEITRQVVTGSGTTQTVTDALGFATKISSDAAGNVLSTRDANALGEDHLYDGAGRRVSTTDTHGSTSSWIFDAEGHVVQSVDALHAVSHVAYDVLGRKVSETDRNGATTHFTYSVADELLTIRDAENSVTTYAYDERHDLTSEAFPPPAGGTRHSTYDAGRRKQTQTDQRGLVTTTHYDNANRQKRRDHSDGTYEAFAYDTSGRLTSATSSLYQTAVDRAYDSVGRLSSDSQTTIDGTVKVGYEYDALSRIANVVLPDGRKLGRSYTKRGEVASGTLGSRSAAFARTYDASGRLRTTIYGNAITEERSFTSPWVLPARIVSGAPGQLPILDLAYVWDNNRRKVDEQDQVGAHEAQHFAYDAAGRVQAWTRSPGDLGAAPPATDTQSWELSPVGDWKNTTINGVLQAREHNAVHEVRAIAGKAVAYDANGNLTAEPSGNRYVWDADNRLASTVQYTDDRSRNLVYQYDALGRRVSRTFHTKTTRFILDGDQIIQEVDARRLLSQADKQSDGAVPAGDEPTPDGAVLDGPDVRRINFQPEDVAIPNGFIGDKGRALGGRSNGLTYGWSHGQATPGTPASPGIPATPAIPAPSTALAAEALIVRDFHPLPQFDTLGTPIDPTSQMTWHYQLPNGTYPVVVVAGDPLSRTRTNHLRLNGALLADPDPATGDGYLKGDFDGWIQQVVVTDGELALSADTLAVHPALCFVEVGPEGTQVTQAMRDKLAALITSATDRTADDTAMDTGRSPRTFVHGSYIDEPLMMEAGSDSTAKRYYFHSNHLYTVQALTDDLGHVVESYSYTAYGERSVAGAGRQGKYGNTRGFTGRETELGSSIGYFRNRYYSYPMGRFIGRDPSGYRDGWSLYSAYFCPNGMDPYGLWDLWTSIKNISAAIVSPVTMSADVITSVLIAGNNLVSDTKIYSEDAHFTSGLGNRLQNNVNMDASGWQDVRAAAVVATALPTGGASGLVDNVATVFENQMTPEGAQEFLAQAALDQSIGAGIGVGISRVSGAGWTGEKSPLNLVGKPGPGVTQAHLEALQNVADELGDPLVVTGSRQTGVSAHTGAAFDPISADLDVGQIGGPAAAYKIYDFMKANPEIWKSIPNVEHGPFRFDTMTPADVARIGGLIVRPNGSVGFYNGATFVPVPGLSRSIDCDKK